jgi:hypothetical protein
MKIRFGQHAEDELLRTNHELLKNKNTTEVILLNEASSFYGIQVKVKCQLNRGF